ncbi:DoxX family protein [Capnocytophaga stomatis]|uniref:DoxX family protein n=1 Tax=Capnocytophaga stomatis TaxID=1848904 RepID=UPI001AC83688|nr:DoxX family protein [Capnocytophaga stomatis]GIM49585.1 membrane protein [Capnocytophaga stomatis]
MNSNVKKIIYWVLTGLVAFVFIATGTQKLISLSDPNAGEGLGSVTNQAILGVMQLVFAVLFLIPRTAVIGTLFLIAYMGGAIAVHFVSGEDTTLQIGIQTLIWITAFYRFPELRKRICGCKEASSCNN